LTTGGRVQWGGGVRTLQDIAKLTGLGVSRVILGTKALDPPFLKEALSHYGKQLGLGLDVRGEEVQVEGWLKSAQQNLFEFFQDLRNYPIQFVVVTDIERDGTLGGVNLPKIQKIISASPCPVIISGGVSRLEDVRALSVLEENAVGKLTGVIVGKALYEKRFGLKDALKAARRAA